ncbi:MAG: segregation ATPase FtsK/SpoIIIE, family, partial [Bacteroidota bacterium]|nr:segregation ATPase FtsK/SpoIIIE, family [Bacteroidota bacterium]
MQSHPDENNTRRESGTRRFIPNIDSIVSASHNTNSGQKSEGTANPDTVLEKRKQRYIRIIAVLLFFISLFILIALISYSPRDEANTEISFKEIGQLISGSEVVKAKLDKTYNWLGLAGAITSNALLNFTFGYIILLLPIIIGLWAKSLFVRYSVSARIIRISILYLLFSFFFSSIAGIIQIISWIPTIPREWSGVVGQFTASILSSIVGTIGAFLIILTCAMITIILGTNINIDKIFLIKRIKFSSPFLTLKSIIGKLFKKSPAEVETEESTITTEEVKPSTFIKHPTTRSDDDIEEPAIIIKRNLGIKNNNPLDFSRRPAFHTFFEESADDYNVYNKQDDFSSKSKKDIFSAPQFNGEETNIQEHPTFHRSDKPKSSPFGSSISEVITNTANFPLITLSEDRKKDFYTDKERTSIEETVNNDLENNYEDENYTEQAEIHEEVETPRHLTININKSISSPETQPENLLSTSIHDEKIIYKQPGLNLLVEQEETSDVNHEELQEKARILQEKLETFKVYIENLQVTPGPVVTQYEFVPAAGIKVSKIESFTDDIAMALKAKGIRIIAPVPGKGTIGIEIPNNNPTTVRFSSLIKSQKFQQADKKLPLALGKTISGEVYIADLARMPHLLIAGSTGSGKSVGVNTMIASLLYKLHPSNLKFVIVDPKKVELNQYSALESHFIAACPDIDDLIITNPQDAVIALKSVCAEMDLRYDILAEAGQRNIFDYNLKVLDGSIRTNKNMVHLPMPYIVVIIDELADLMLTASKEVEPPIIRLAQLARAVGIHLIVATQRPSVDVITGIIKANFPARIAYLVATKIDSRTILDINGAEQLLGNGDMLFMSPGSKPFRLQNALITTDEIEDICSFIGNQTGYSEPYLLPSLNDGKSSGGGI